MVSRVEKLFNIDTGMLSTPLVDPFLDLRYSVSKEQHAVHLMEGEHELRFQWLVFHRITDGALKVYLHLSLFS